MIRITDGEIDVGAVLASVGDPDCGANVLFTGTTRRMTGQRETTLLEYECYEKMAIARMEALLQNASDQWPITNGSIVHRIGRVDVGQISIAVAVSSAHRVDAFAAAVWLVDALKQEVPIWKREIWADGQEEWVHPESARLAKSDNTETPTS